MGEKKRRERRTKEAVKPTEKLIPFEEVTQPELAQKQKQFCIQVIDCLLQDESAMSFSKPVDELWDESITQDYFERIQNPMDLGTVKKNLVQDHFINQNTKLFDANAFRKDLRLVFLNALEYNAKGTDLARFATKFCNYVDNEFNTMPKQNQLDDNNNQQNGNNSNNDDDDNENENENDDEQQQEKQKQEGMKKDDDKEIIESIPNKKTRSERRKSTKDISTNDNMDVDDDITDGADGTIYKDESNLQVDQDKLSQKLGDLQKERTKIKSTLEQLEKDSNQSFTHGEYSKLRDEIEALPWENAQKVVNILKEYVDEALQKSDEQNPEFVTLEFTSIDIKLLHKIRRIIHPDPKIEKEKKSLADLEEQIVGVKRKIRGDESRKKRRKS